MVNWNGDWPVDLRGDMAIIMPNKHWPRLRLDRSSDDVRAALKAVGMNDVGVLSSRFCWNQQECYIAASTTAKLAMASLTAR